MFLKVGMLFERLLRFGFGGFRCGSGGFYHAGKALSLSRS